MNLAYEAREMLEFLAGRMEYAGVADCVAKSYAHDIRLLLATSLADKNTSEETHAETSPTGNRLLKGYK